MYSFIIRADKQVTAGVAGVVGETSGGEPADYTIVSGWEKE